MGVKVGNGELAPHLFELPLEQFKQAIPTNFRESLFMGHTTDYESALEEVYHGNKITSQETTTPEPATAEVNPGKPKRSGSRRYKAESGTAQGGKAK